MHSPSSKRSTRRHLAVGIVATALSSALADVSAMGAAAPDRIAPPASPAGFNVAEVTSCADDGSPGTLRTEIANTADPAEIDLTHLTCSTITLQSGEIVAWQSFMHIIGSGQTIDAHGASRVFHQTTAGEFLARDVNIVNGYVKYDQPGQNAYGGCILAPGTIDIALQHVILNNCKATNPYANAAGGAVHGFWIEVDDSYISNSEAYGANARGGGAYASYYIEMTRSALTANTAKALGTTSYAAGGGLYSAGSFSPFDAVIAGNVAETTEGTASGGGLVANNGTRNIQGYVTILANSAISPLSTAGGFVSRGDGYLYGALVASNTAAYDGAGLVLRKHDGTSGTFQIVDSTISSNQSTTGSSAVAATEPIYLLFSTIAFNQAAGTHAGLELFPGADTTIISTIIANNTSTSGGSSYDVASQAAITGDHDLIMSANCPLPSDTIQSDPHLLPLSTNGGPTLTHALADGSPAIDAGRLARTFIDTDQRLSGFARAVGPSADIGAYEVQSLPNVIFGSGFEP